MTDIWFAADLHLSHKAMVEGFADGTPGCRSDRFDTIEQHDAEIIERINAVAKPGSKLYLLGDLAMGTRGARMLTQLHATLRLGLGNHDEEKANFYASVARKVWGAKCLDGVGKGMLLTHIPVHASCLNRRSMQVNVHGHLHEERVQDWHNDCGFVPDRRYRCVSLEQIDYRPIHIDTLKAEFGDLLQTPECREPS